MKKGKGVLQIMKKKQTGKFMAMALTAAMLGGMLAGCGNNAANAPADTTPAPETPAVESSAVQESTPAEETPAASGEQVTIKVAHWDSYTEPSTQMLVDGFEAANPNIKVELIDIASGEYSNKLTVMLNGGNDLDVVWVKDPDNTPSIAERGQFEELAKKVTSGEGNDKKYGALFHTWQACVQNWAVQDGKHTILDTDYSFMKPYYEMALRMQDEGTVMDYSTLKTGNIHYSSVFMEGQCAMMPMGSWFMSTMIEKTKAGETSVNWGVATLPHPDGVEAGWTVGSTTPMGVSASSKNKDAAWEFVKYCSGEEGAKIYADCGMIPARMNADTIKALAALDGMPEGLEEALQTKHVAMDRPLEVHSAEVNQMLGEEHSLIMIKELSIDDGLAEMGERSKEIQGK